MESSIGLPTAVPGITDAQQVAAGSGLTCVLRAGGNVQCWGVNVNGQLGDGMTSHGQTCTRDGEASDCSFTPVDVTTIDDASFLAVNTEHACAIRGNGSVWCWGLNTNRELGDGTRENRFEPVEVQNTAPRQ